MTGYRAGMSFNIIGRARLTHPGIKPRRRQFYPGEKKGPWVGKGQSGKGAKWRVVVDGAGIPLENYLDPPHPSEIGLSEATPLAVDRCADSPTP